MTDSNTCTRAEDNWKCTARQPSLARLWRAMPRCIPRMLDDFDRDRAAAVEAGIGAGQDFGREEDDEQPAGQDRGPAIKGRVEAEGHGRRKRRTINDLIPIRVGDDPSPAANLSRTHGGSPRFFCATRPTLLPPSGATSSLTPSSTPRKSSIFTSQREKGCVRSTSSVTSTPYQTLPNSNVTSDPAVIGLSHGLNTKRPDLFVFPHRNQELSIYGAHIDDTFAANPSAPDRVLIR